MAQDECRYHTVLSSQRSNRGALMPMFTHRNNRNTGEISPLSNLSSLATLNFDERKGSVMEWQNAKNKIR